MTEHPIQGGNRPPSDSQTNGVIDSPEVDQPAYGGQLWPTPPGPNASASVISRPQRPDLESRKPTRSGRRVGLVAVLLAVAAGTFGIGLGIGGANAARKPLPPPPGQTYDAGFAEGLRTGGEEGYGNGFNEGRSEGFTAGRKDGYHDGFAAGRMKGFRTGWVRGCRSIFDELETNRVIDRVPGPGERYWYLTRDQC